VVVIVIGIDIGIPIIGGGGGAKFAEPNNPPIFPIFPGGGGGI
jgi:hypothetical protein